jgi:hypothetical protein
MDESRIEAAILDALAARGPGKSVCPSEIARALAADWRSLMPEIRRVAGALAAEGRLAATRRGAVVDPETPGGPIRLRLPDAGQRFRQ